MCLQPTQYLAVYIYLWSICYVTVQCTDIVVRKHFIIDVVIPAFLLSLAVGTGSYT